jgi:glycoside/pentoside/hexuronide:cation symporter, GPH family
MSHLNRSTKFFYGLGSAPYGIKDNGFNFFLLIFYAQVLGLPHVLASAAIAIAIVVDAISDPIIGYISDNWRSRWGRRHPFMYASIIPICLSYAFLWNPPAAVVGDETLLFIFLIVMAISIRMFLTFFEVPNTALISELSDDYDERTGLMSLRYMFGWIGGIGMAILAYTVFLTDRGDGNGIFQAQGFGYYGIAAASLMFFGMLASSLGTHKNIARLHVPAKRDATTLSIAIKELRETFRNRSFQALFIASIFSGTAAGLQATLSVFFSTFLWGLTAENLGVLTVLQLIAAVTAVPVARLLGRKFDKKRAAMGSFLFVISFGPLMLIGRLLDIVPVNGDPRLLPLLFAHNLIEVCAIIVFSILFGAMMADVVEDSAASTTRRSEGVIFAARNFAGKMVSGLGIMISGLILTLAKLPPGARPDQVDESVIFNVVFMAVPVQVICYLCALMMISRYNITRLQHNTNVSVVKEKLAEKTVN